MGFEAYFDSTTNASICLRGSDVAGMAITAITLTTQREAGALPGNTRPRAHERSWGMSRYQPSSDHLSTAVWGQPHGWKIECTSHVPAALETTLIKQRRYGPCTFLLPAVLGIHPLLFVIPTLLSLGKRGFLTAWHTPRSSWLAGAAGHCNGLRTLVLPKMGRPKSTYSGHLQYQWEHGNQREAPFLLHEVPSENLSKVEWRRYSQLLKYYNLSKKEKKKVTSFYVISKEREAQKTEKIN